MKKIGVIILMSLTFFSLLFLPIFDVATYNYNYAEIDMQKIMEEHAQNNFGKSVSVLKYRQSTGGSRWIIKSSTDNNLVGPVFPMWMISPMFLRDDVKYKENTFLYREVMVVTDEKKTIHKLSYDGETCSVIFPEKIIVVMPDEFGGKVYHAYDLSALGIVLLYFKVSIVFFIIWIIVRIIFKTVIHIRKVFIQN